MRFAYRAHGSPAYPGSKWSNSNWSQTLMFNDESTAKSYLINQMELFRNGDMAIVESELVELPT